MHDRGQKIPERPVPREVPEDLVDDEEPTIDEVAEALANTIEEETGLGAIVAHPEEIERLRKATTHRLNEMLDMDLYEVARYGPDTVTHQEAAREAALIEAELKRRKAA